MVDPAWTGRPLWTWSPAGRQPRPLPARPGPYQPVPAWVTALAGFTDDRTGRPRALVTSYAGARVVLDLLGGDLAGAVDDRAHARVSAITRIDGEQLIVSGAGAGYLQVSDLDSGRSRWRQWCGDVRSLATVMLAGRPLAVLTGGSPRLEIWSLGTDSGVRLRTLRTGGGRISVLAATEAGESAVLAVGTSGGRLPLWRLEWAAGDEIRAEPLGEPAFEVSSLVTAVDFATWRDRPVLLGAAGRVARAWDPVDGQPLGPPFVEHTGQVNSVVPGWLDDRPVLWSGDDATVRAWLPESGRQVAAFRYPYEAAPTRTIAVEIAGRSMLATGDGAGLVWVWDPERPYPFRPDPLPAAHAAAPDAGSVDEVGPAAVAGPTRCLAVAGRPAGQVLLAGPVRGLAGSVAGPVRGFDPVTGVEVRLPLDGVPGGVALVAGTAPLLAAPEAEHLALWDPTSGKRIGAVPVGTGGATVHAAAGLASGRPMLLVAAGTALFRMDPATGQLTGPVTGHPAPIRAVAVGELVGVPVGLTAAEDDAVRLWQLDDRGVPGWRVLDGHGGAAYAALAATVDGRGLVFGAGRNGQVRSVDVTDLLRSRRAGAGSGQAGRALAELLPEPAVVLTATGPVRSLAVVPAGRTTWLVAADGSVLRWQLLGHPGTPGQTIDLGAPVTDLVALPELLAVAIGDGLLGYRPPPDPTRPPGKLSRFTPSGGGYQPKPAS
ncbi:WD40 repeat domain-containing protein [Plantactinospora sp. WMMC1484]|uniref:WD40 repeat domain-containing protein n=1 Tax=Plantactinospora sp. WMMC1484 TaxID=3404122 RepID=UPI003BF55484